MIRAAHNPSRSKAAMLRRTWCARAVCLACLLMSGCSSIFSKPVMSAVPQPIPWLASLAAPSVDMTPPFDLAQIQPVSKSGIGVNDLLEVTIWDLYEPGKPHTFPTRVDAQFCVAVPHLDPIVVKGSTPAEIESRLTTAYRDEDLLKQPRILVRELPSPPLHIYVTGAVLRPGLIDLPTDDPSVFAALVAAGGLSRGAGLHVFVSERNPSSHVESSGATADSQADVSPLVAGNTGLELPNMKKSKEPRPENPQGEDATEPAVESDSAPPEQLVNHSDPLTVSGSKTGPDARTTEQNSSSPSGVVEAVATRPDFPSGAARSDQPGRWYDLSVERDRDQLKKLILRDGDMVTVRPAAPPVRITGAVGQPGSYRAPATGALTLPEAVQLAGGFTTSDKPVIAVLTRPATAERGLQRWSFRMGRGEKLPADMPTVQPGDMVHVEPTARARVQSLVDSIWPGN